MDKANLSRRGFLASAGTVLASLTFSLASGPAAAFAQDGETSAGSPTADGGGQTGADEDAAVDDSHIVIVHTNDVHCAFTNKTTQLGYAKLSDYVADQRSKHGDARVTLVDAGDNIQGDINGSLSQGEYPARVIGACKYDVMTCGNHEFDYGMQTFFGVRQTEDTPTFAATLWTPAAIAFLTPTACLSTRSVTRPCAWPTWAPAHRLL